MRLIEEKVAAVNEKYDNTKIELGIGASLSLNIQNSISGLTVFKGNWAICKVENIDNMIKELQLLKDTIREEVGIY